MESRVFFRMVLEGRRDRAIARMDDCRVQAIAIQDTNYFKDTVKFYEEQIPKSQEEIQRITARAEASVLHGNQARKALIKAFKKGRG